MILMQIENHDCNLLKYKTLQQYCLLAGERFWTHIVRKRTVQLTLYSMALPDRMICPAVN